MRPSTRALCIALGVTVVGGAGLVPAAAAAAGTDLKPVVTNLSSHHGVWWGGNRITITGQNFTHVRKVLFGKRHGYGLEVRSPTELTVLDPSHRDGKIHVRVVTAAGTSIRRSADTFTFTPARMTTPIFGGLSARQERHISARVVRTHHGVHIARRAHRWTPAMGHTAMRRARSWLGLPYSWAGGDGGGPTHGACARNGGDNDCRVVGFDCSGLTLYAWSPYRSLVHFAQTQKRRAGRFHPTIGELVPGDLVFFSSYIPHGIGHTAIYAGHGTVIQAEQSGTLIMRSRLRDVIAASGTYRGATRPMTTGRQGKDPVVSSMTKTVAATGGNVTITGRRLNRVQSVAFGRTHVYSFLRQTARRLVVRTPAHAVGAGVVRVSSAWATSRHTIHYLAPTGSSAANRLATSKGRDERPGRYGPQHRLGGRPVTHTGDHVGNHVAPTSR